MGNRIVGRGNVGAAPALKHVEIDGESLPVANLRIYFDRPAPDGEGRFDDLTYAVALRASVDQRLARAIVSAVFDTIVRSLASGEAVSIQGFGKFDILEQEKHIDPTPGAHEAELLPGHPVRYTSLPAPFRRLRPGPGST